MKKTVIIVLVALFVAVGAGIAFLHQTKSNELDSLVEETKNSDLMYKPPAEEAEASSRLENMEKKYPSFFRGSGMQDLDFQVRTELEEEHKKRIAEATEERNADADEKLNEYQYVLGGKERINEYLTYKDSILKKDLEAYQTYDAEKIDFLDHAVKYCESNASIKKYVAEQAGTENYIRQLGFVLNNADDNLCRKL